MTKTLIIAEKPSVANDIAKTLGGFTKHDEYFESEDYVLSSLSLRYAILGLKVQNSSDELNIKEYVRTINEIGLNLPAKRSRGRAGNFILKADQTAPSSVTPARPLLRQFFSCAPPVSWLPQSCWSWLLFFSPVFQSRPPPPLYL